MLFQFLSGIGFSFHDRSHCCLISNEGEHSNEFEAKAEQFIFLNLNYKLSKNIK